MHAVCIEVVNLLLCHWFRCCANTDETSFGRETILLFVIRLLSSARHENFNDGLFIYTFYCYVKESHRSRQDSVANTVFNSKHIAINVFDVNRLTIIVNADIDNASFAVIKEGYNFFLDVQFASQLALKFYAVCLNHTRLYLYMCATRTQNRLQSYKK